MKKAFDPDRCATSQRCRQPVVFAVTTRLGDGEAWMSLVCSKHLGLLCERRSSDDWVLTVKRLPVPAKAVSA